MTIYAEDTKNECISERYLHDKYIHLLRSSPMLYTMWCDQS